MPRIARKYFKSSFKHIIVQGINKEAIFEKEEYIEKYKEIILKKLFNSNILILAYCIMNNHAHFLIYCEKNENLSKYMQKVNTAYSVFYNKIKNRVGYVFRDRYYSQDILTKKQLYNCFKYIHNNPVKANICKDISQYKNSSYNEFLDKKKIISENGIKLLFGSIVNYKEKFLAIHNCMDIEEEFIDIKDKTIEQLKLEIEKKYNKKLDEIKTDKNILKNVIKEARKETNITIIELSKLLNVSKNTIGKYIREQKMGN